MPERHPGWVTGINDFEARLATGALLTSQHAVDQLDPLRVRSGLRDGNGQPGRVVFASNRLVVNPFQAVIQDPARPGLGAYLVTLDAPKELALTASDPSLGRVDLVIAEVDPAVEPGFTVRVVEGDRGATPQPPAVTNALHLKLAQVSVPPGTTAPTVTDLRQFTAALGGILPVRGTADLPVDAPGSLFVYRLDRGELHVRKGGQWVAYRPPRGSVDTWHPAPFATNWANYGSSFAPCAYTVTEDGWVRLRGLARTTVARAVGAAIFSLPIDYRPRFVPLLTVTSSNGPIRLDISTGGAVAPQAVLQAGDWVSLDNLSFASYA